LEQVARVFLMQWVTMVPTLSFLQLHQSAEVRDLTAEERAKMEFREDRAGEVQVVLLQIQGARELQIKVTRAAMEIRAQV
jgi:hypothetical protein